jgi:molybdopterin synthase sulfur carrier subunit
MMAQIHFTSWLRTVVPDAPVAAPGNTVGEALEALMAERPHVRSYVLDEQGRLRRHVCIFADGARLPREAALTHPIRPDSELHVMQALSGG